MKHSGVCWLKVTSNIVIPTYIYYSGHPCDKAVIMSSGMLIQWNLYVVVTTTRWQSEICISSPVADPENF